MNYIYFHDLDIRSKLKNRRQFKIFLSEIFRKERKLVSRIDIIFCTDEYLLNLNKQFLNHNYFTDTLSFQLSPPEEPITGDIYISVDTVIFNSAILGTSYDNELYRVVIHSCLHLCGYLDKPKSKSLVMAGKQEGYLEDWFVSRETQIGR